MKSPLRLSQEQVAALRPGDVRHYLISRGWVSDAEPNGAPPKALTFHHPDRPGVELLLPLDRSLGDYALRMADVVTGLARLEERPVDKVLNDLSMTSGDVFRFRVAGPVAKLGNLPLDEAIKLVQGSRQLLWSSAASVLHPQPLISQRPIRQVDEFIESCRLGQTERGSFVATVIAPVPPEIQPHLDFGEEPPEDEPFARQVSRRFQGDPGRDSASHPRRRTPGHQRQSLRCPCHDETVRGRVELEHPTELGANATSSLPCSERDHVPPGRLPDH